MVHLIVANWWEKRKRILTASLFRRTTKWWVYVGRWASSENKHVSMMFAHLINRQHVCLLSNTNLDRHSISASFIVHTKTWPESGNRDLMCWVIFSLSDWHDEIFFWDLFWPWNAWKIRKSWRKWGRFPAAQKLSGEEIGNESPTQDAFVAEILGCEDTP